MSVWPSVREVWVDFTKRFEGWTDFLYQDVKGLITCGMGNLVDTVPHSAEPTNMVLSLPWLRADGSPATPQDITDAWHAVSARDDLRLKGGGTYSSVTTIRLSKLALGQLIARKFDENTATLAKRFPAFPTWHADAQLGTHGMAWAMGASFKYPKFQAAALADPPDFVTMANECAIPGGYALRNAATKLLFLTAAAAQRARADTSRLFWPGPGPEVAVATGIGLGVPLLVGGMGFVAWRYFRRGQVTVQERTQVVTHVAA